MNKGHPSQQQLNESQRMMLEHPNTPKLNSVWKHYKEGTLYKVVGFSTREETEEIAVLYSPIEGDLLLPWDRTLSKWNEIVVFNGKPVPRFSRMEGVYSYFV